jgi:hypothetical protein
MVIDFLVIKNITSFFFFFILFNSNLIEQDSPMNNNQSQSNILNITENEKLEIPLKKAKSPGNSSAKKKKQKRNLSTSHLILNKENLDELKPISIKYN